MLHFVYIIYSGTYNKYYKGYSLAPLKRLVQHNNKESRYTSSFTPWKLVYIEQFQTQKEALIREKRLKKYSKAQILQLIQSSKNKLR